MVGVTLTDNEYGVQLAETLNLLRIEQKWTDCCLETKTGKVHVHHVVLAAVVEKLQITSLILSGSKQTFLLKDFNEHIVETFITYLYTGNLKLSSEIDIREFVKLCKHLEFSTLLSHKQFQKYLVSLNDNDTELNDSEFDNKSKDVPYPIYLTSNRSLLVSTDQIIDNAAQVIKSSLPHSVSTTSHVSEPVQISLPHSVSTISSVGEQVPNSSKNMDSEKFTESTEQSSEIEMQIKQEIVFEEDFSFTSYMNTCSEQTLDTLMTSVSSVDKQNTHKSANELNPGKSKNTAKQLSSFKAKKGNLGMKICEKNKGRKNISSSVSNPSAHKYAKELVSVHIGADETKLDQEEVESIVPTDEVKVEKESDSNSENITMVNSFELAASDEIIKSEEIKASFVCHVCHFSTKHKSSLSRHKKLKHPDPSPPDPSPQRYIISPSSTYLCDQCATWFGTSTGYKSHYREKHSFNFRYVCATCQRGFDRKWNYQGHLASHHEVVRESCYICKAQYRYKKNLIQHMKTVHGSNDLKCKFCRANFSSCDTLREHVKVIHDGRKYTCKFCGKSYRWRSSLHHHNRTCKHPFLSLEKVDFKNSE